MKTHAILPLAVLAVIGLIVAPAALGAAGKEETVTLEIKGLHCGSCADAVQTSLKQAKGVREAKVDFDTKEAVVKYDSSACKVEDLIQVVRKTEGMSTFDAQVKKK